MSGAGTGYDLSPSTYNPEGRVFQIDYAIKATENSNTVVGIKFRDGILLGADKSLLSRMLVPGTNRYQYAIHKHAGMVATGVVPDARALASRARQEAAQYLEVYGKEMGVRIITDRLSQYMHAHTLYWAVRPFGNVVILAGLEAGKPKLYMTDPSGEQFEFQGCSAGKGRQICMTELDKLTTEEMTCREGLFHLARMLIKSRDESSEKRFELEAFWLCEENEFTFTPVPNDLIKAAESDAEAAIEREEMGEAQGQLGTLVLQMDSLKREYADRKYVAHKRMKVTLQALQSPKRPAVSTGRKTNFKREMLEGDASQNADKILRGEIGLKQKIRQRTYRKVQNRSRQRSCDNADYGDLLGKLQWKFDSIQKQKEEARQVLVERVIRRLGIFLLDRIERKEGCDCISQSDISYDQDACRLTSLQQQFIIHQELITLRNILIVQIQLINKFQQVIQQTLQKRQIHQTKKMVEKYLIKIAAYKLTCKVQVYRLFFVLKKVSLVFKICCRNSSKHIPRDPGFPVFIKDKQDYQEIGTPPCINAFYKLATSISPSLSLSKNLKA